MPLHTFYSVPGTFSAKDKAAIAEGITNTYSILPKFYVVVQFIDVAEDSFFVGGKSASKFVRIVTKHLARKTTAESQHQMDPFVEKLEAVWAPYIKDRGYNWELHIEEHERWGWRLDGLKPPMPNTEEEKLWVKENRAVPYKA